MKKVTGILRFFFVVSFLILFASLPTVNEVKAQTAYTMSSGNYSEQFTNIANTTNWPNNFNGTDCAEWAAVAVNATGTIGDGVRTTVSTATFASGSSGGVQRGTANIQLLSTSTANSCAIDLLLNFSGRKAGTISFDLATVFNSTGDRDSKLKLFYSTDGTTFTELTGTNLPFTARNNVTSSASITNISLPASFTNSSTARLRFYQYSTTTGGGTSPTGSQAKISIDNITVTSTAIVDGTITAGEYGTHTNGFNQQSSATGTWYMNWDDSYLYVGLSGTNTGEGAIVYIDKNPVTPVNGGTNADGTNVGFNNYDGSNFAQLQFRADLVAYFKDSYREYRTADGANSWSAATSSFGFYASASGTSGTKELAIPWSALGGKPASFNWFGYVAYSGGGAYASIPTENPGSGGGTTIGSSARWERYYTVSSTTTGSSTAPFSRNSYVFNNTSDANSFGAISVYDFTMNSSGRYISRTGATSQNWSISGNLIAGAGTIYFGSGGTNGSYGTTTISGKLDVRGGTVNMDQTTSALNVTGNVALSSGTLQASGNAFGGGDIKVGGNWTNSGGTFTPAGRAVFFNAASGDQTITNSSGETFDYLFVDKAAGNVILANNITCNQTLTLTNGLVNTGANKVIIAATGGLSRTNGWINGNLQRNFSVGSAVSRSYAIGTSTNYLPVDIVANVSATGGITISTANGEHANIGSSPINSSKNVNRNWTLTNNGLTLSSNYTATFNFLSGDVDAGANTANFRAAVYNGSSWALQTAGSRTATSTQMTGVTAFGGVAIGEDLLPAITSTLTASGTYNDAFSYTITGSNTPTSFTSTTLPSGLTLNGTTGVISGTAGATGTFNVDITATNAAGSDTKTLVITIAKASQSISFGTIPTHYTGDAPFNLSATASSGLSVSYSSSNTSVATISGNTVTIIGEGTSTITASQAGDDNYNAATSVDQTLTVISLSTPIITVTGTLSASTTTYGTAGNAGSFTVSGSALTNDITLTPPAGFEISVTSATTGFASTLTLSQSSGAVAETTVYVRLAATTDAGSYSGDIEAASSGATSQQIAVPSSTVNTLGLTITGISIGNKTYDGLATATISGFASLSGIVNNDDVSLIGTPTAVFANANVGTAKQVTISGYSLSGADATNYTVAQPSGLTANITAVALTVTGAVVADKTYDGTTTALFDVDGTLNGVIGSEDVALDATGNFATADAGTNIAVTLTLVGSDIANYTLTQPGITGNIFKADQTISFGALPAKTTASADFAPGATSATSGVNPIAYSSSNTAVATIVSGNIHIVGAGTTTITASQAASTNYNAANDVTQSLTVTLAPVTLAAWDFTGEGTTTNNTSTADVYNASLDASSNLTRGSGAAYSSGSNSFRTTGFQNNGISTSNTDYFQFTLSASSGSVLSLKTIDARYAGTASFNVSPGVTSQFAYSIDGTNFTLIGSPNQSTSLVSPQIDLSGISALQNVGASTTVTFRYYASGQTTTGGWGFSSTAAGVYGLAIGGNITALPTVSTSSASSITTNSVVIGGNVTADGGSAITARGTVYGASASPTGNSLAEGGTSTGSFTQTRSSLNVNTLYYYRAYATNDAGTAYGADSSFYTLANIPSTPTVDNATSATIDVTINVNSNPASTEFLIQEVNSGNYVQADGSLGAGAVWKTSSGWGVGGKVVVNSLSPNTSYSFQIKARNGNNVETDYSSAAGATTSAQAPVVSYSGVPAALSTTYGTASATTNISVSGVYLNGDVTVTAPSGFEISTSTSGSYSGSLNLSTISGTLASTTVYIRLTATANAGSYSGNLQLSSSGATTVNAALSSSTVNTVVLSISGVSASDKTYDATTAATVTGTPVLNGIIGSDDVSVSGTASASFADKNVGNGKSVTVTGYSLTGTAAANYTVTQPSGLTANITAATVTVTGASAANKSYDGNTNATISGGTVVGVLGSDVVGVSSVGTFASANAGSAIVVTIALNGTDAVNYSLTQPGITADITQAAQTITFNALPVRTTADATYTLFATSTSGLTVNFSSSNAAVATISGNVVTIVGPGTTTISATQSGDANYAAATQVDQSQLVNFAIAKWSFEGVTTTNTGSTPTISTGSAIADLGAQTSGTLFSANHASSATVWSNPAGNGSAKSITSTGWGVGDYYQFKANTTGYRNIGIGFEQTGSNTGPSTYKIQYSVDGTSFTDFGSTFVLTNDGWSATTYKSASLRNFDLSSIAALNNNAIVYFRIVNTSTNAISGTLGTSGTNRLDNFVVIGNNCETTTSTSSATACDSYVWNGNTYTTSGTYSYTTINSVGCDSIAVLNLTINTSSTPTSLQATACTSYDLPWSETATTSGNYVHTYTNASGCDSVVTINVTINETTYSSTSVAACNNSLPYTWNGQNYSSAGTYTWTGTNASGCDSIATLVLSISYGIDWANTQWPASGTICKEGTYTVYSQAYEAGVTNGSGAGTGITAELGYSNSNTNPNTWTNWQAATFNTQVGNNDEYQSTLSGLAPGTYYYAFRYTYNGCTEYTGFNGGFWNGTSNVNGVLTVNDGTYNASSVTVCNSYTWNGTTYTASGDYTYNYFNGNGCASVDTLHLTINVKPVLGSIQGPTDVCPNVGQTPVLYTIPTVTGAAGNTYSWIVPVGATIVSGQGNDSIYVTIDSTFALTNSRFKVSAVSDFGCASDTSVLVVLKNVPNIPSSITGPTNVCPYINLSTAVSYSCDSVPYATSYLWTMPTGVTLLSGQGTRFITVQFGNFTTGSIKVNALSNCGTRSPRALTLTRPVPGIPVSISGPANACTYIGTATQVSYTIAPVANATSYLWTVPAGMNIISGQGTTTLIATFSQGFIASSLKVRAVANCGSSADKTLSIVGATFSAPGPISGPTNACPFVNNNDAVAVYTIRKVANAPAYIWTVPTGATIVSHPGGTGANDTIIQVSFNSNFVFGSSITVQTTGCGTSAPRSIVVGGILPSTPGIIAGPTNVCEFMVSATNPNGNLATYTIRRVTGASSYAWTAPANSSIISHPAGTGDNDTVVLVKFNSDYVTGVLTVRSVNACGNSTLRSLSISKLNPATPGVFDVVQVSACPSRIYTYTMAAMPANTTSVLWTVPAGATIISGQGTASLTVSYPPTNIGGQVTAQALNNCSSSAVRALNIKLQACPASFAGDGNIPGKSTIIDQSEGAVSIAPNPSAGPFNIQLKNFVKAGEQVKIRVMDQKGALVKQVLQTGGASLQLGADLKQGVYFVEIQKGNDRITRRVVRY